MSVEAAVLPRPRLRARVRRRFKPPNRWQLYIRGWQLYVLNGLFRFIVRWSGPGGFWGVVLFVTIVSGFAVTQVLFYRLQRHVEQFEETHGMPMRPPQRGLWIWAAFCWSVFGVGLWFV